MNNDHLTVEQIEVLLAHPDRRAECAHLRACEFCSEEIESLHAVVSDLRDAVAASSEEHRRLAVMPAPAHRTPRALWGLVAAAVLLCVAAPVSLHHQLAHVAVVRPQAQPAKTAVSDEELMSDVQQDLGSPVPQGLLPLTAKDPSIDATGTTTSSSKENE